MLGLPESTKIKNKKIIPKKIIFEKFHKELKASRKKSFNDEIARIIITNEISPYSLNVEEGSEVKKIFVIQIELRGDQLTDANISLLSRFFDQKIIYLISYGDKFKLAIYQGKLFQTNYQEPDNLKIQLEGMNLDTIWQNLVLSISGYELEGDRDLAEQIDVEETKQRLIKKIEKLDREGRRETQPRKKFEKFQEMKRLQKELEEL